MKRISTYSINACPCCGSKRITRLGKRRELLSNSNCLYEIIFYDHVCEDCTFVFSTYRPNETEIADYYVNYHIDSSTSDEAENLKRLKYLQKQLPAHARDILELGGGKRGSFKTFLESQGYRVFSFEIGESFPSGRFFDAVISYYLLEHINDLQQLIASSCECLNEDGLFVFEVPDFVHSPLASLNEEHVNHFTAKSLVRLAINNKLYCCDVDPTASSRHFGLCGTFKKIQASTTPKTTTQAQHCISIYQDAVRARQLVTSNILKIVLGEHDTAKPLLIWGANQNCVRLIDLFEQHDIQNYSIVDASDAKQSLRIWSKPVLNPETIEISDYSAVLICAARAFETIEGHINQLPGGDILKKHKIDFSA